MYSITVPAVVKKRKKKKNSLVITKVFHSLLSKFNTVGTSDDVGATGELYTIPQIQMQLIHSINIPIRLTDTYGINTIPMLAGTSTRNMITYCTDNSSQSTKILEDGAECEVQR
uniref:Uncharacterized protein n=1 Tax=Lygus hesperus TaxID=30085 RepID=A0A146LGA3_LYGHE